jgi:hypothetical protein
LAWREILKREHRMTILKNTYIATVLFFNAASCALAQGGQTLAVPSDAKAQYFVLDKSGGVNSRVIVTKRVGSSGISYSRRLYNCSYNTVKYLGSGDSLAAMDASSPDANMSNVNAGSTAYYVGLEACR